MNDNRVELLENTASVAPGAPVGGPPQTPQKRRKPLVQELLETLLLTLLLFAVARFSLQNFKVEGVSMVPTLQDSEYILVDKISYRLHLPARGDIIVFKFPQDTTRDFIKRVIAQPGDRFEVHLVKDATNPIGTYRAFVNGRMLSEPYINGPLDAPYPTTCNNLKTCTPFVVPKDNLFVMGDNRPASYDSRAWGTVPLDDVIGRALIAYWPIQHLSFLANQFSYATAQR